MLNRHLLARVVIAIVFFGAWQLIPSVGLIDPRILPPPSDVFVTLFGLLSEASFWANVWTTLAEVAVAFAIAVPVSALLGILISENPLAYRVFKPFVFFIFSIPKSIFLPIFILVFGIAFWEKIAFGIFSTAFIVMMTAFAAIDSVREDHIRVARSYGATTWQTVTRVYLPSMTPVLLEALRLAMIFNFTGILIAEMYASRGGLGFVIAAWGRSFQLNQLLAAVVLIAALSIAFNEFIRSIEKRCEHWRS